MSVVITTDEQNRLTFKQELSSKVEQALAPPTPEVEPGSVVVEIIEKYAVAPVTVSRTATRLFRPLEATDPIPQGVEEDVSFVLDSDAPKRTAFKQNLFGKVADALTPATEPEAEPVEVIDSYSPWRETEPLETIDPGLKPEQPFILDRDVPKRAAFKDRLVTKVVQTLAPATPGPEPQPIEIIEHYARGTQRPWDPAIAIDLGFDANRAVVVPDGVLHSDIPQRNAFRQNLFTKVDETLDPRAPADEAPAPVEIIEKYAHGVQRSFTPRPSGSIEPGFEEARKVVVPDAVLDSDIPRRDAFKQSLLGKVDEVLSPTPPEVEPEPAPVEIIEKYAHGVQRSFTPRPSGSIEPGFEEARKVVVPDAVLDSDIPRRDAFKQSLLGKVDEVLSPTPPEVEPEPAPVEIIEKYAHGPSDLLDPDEMAPEFKKAAPFILDSDVPKRQATREALLTKAAVVAPQPIPVEDVPVEIIGYSPRTPNPLGFDFPIVARPLEIDDSFTSTEAATPAPVDTTPGPILRLPVNYRELDEPALYGVLIRTPYLKHSSDTANLALDILAGRSSHAAEFMVVEDPAPVSAVTSMPVESKLVEIPEQFKVQDQEKRLAVAAQLLTKVNRVSVKTLEAQPEPEAVPPFDIPEDWKGLPPTVVRGELLSVGATPEEADTILSWFLRAEPVPPAPSPPVAELAVELPTDFGSLRAADKYTYLTRHALLSPEDANDAIAAFESAPQRGNKVFAFSFAEIVDPGKRQERRELLSEKAAVEHVTPVIEEPEHQTFLLPSNYTDLSEVELHYLMAHTAELGYAPETVYEALDILFGRTPQPTHISFETIPLDNPVVIGRRDQTVSVTKIESTPKPKARSVI